MNEVDNTTVGRAENMPVSGRGRRVGWRISGVLGAGIVNVLIWIVAVPIGGITIEFVPAEGPATPVGAPELFVFSVAPALAGWLLLALLERFTDQARRIWTISALVVLGLSYVPLLLVGFSTEMTAVFAVMHVAVAIVLIPTFRYSAVQGEGRG